MALADTPHRVFQKGDWPGLVSFRRGWARGEARPWNATSEDASLRLIRGGSGFIEACTHRLHALGAPGVMSPPLAQSARKPWASAGFVPFVELALMRLDLTGPIAPPQHLVVREEEHDLDLMLAVDTAAFDRFWRFSKEALAESLQATSKSNVFVIRDGDLGITGYAIVGYGHAISYLQRVAVDPKWQGSGMGRSLIRAAARSARRQGSKALLLNTQLDNIMAAGLYETEGYIQLPESLTVLKAE